MIGIEKYIARESKLSLWGLSPQGDRHSLEPCYRRGSMTAIQKLLHELVEELPDKEAAEVVDFIEYLKLKKEKELDRELQNLVRAA